MNSQIPEPCNACVHRMVCCLVIDDECKSFLSVRILEIAKDEMKELTTHKGQNLSLFGGENEE